MNEWMDELMTFAVLQYNPQAESKKRQGNKLGSTRI